MIKGCNKRVIVMKDVGNSVFEEAFFILKPGTEKTAQTDILFQAQKIIDENEKTTQNGGREIIYNVDKERKKKSAPLFFAGAFTGFALTLAVMLII